MLFPDQPQSLRLRARTRTAVLGPARPTPATAEAPIAFCSPTSGLARQAPKGGRQPGTEASRTWYRAGIVKSPWIPRGASSASAVHCEPLAAQQSGPGTRRYVASARSARARRTYDRIMSDNPLTCPWALPRLLPHGPLDTRFWVLCLV